MESFNDKPRALTIGQAEEQGLVPTDYTYKNIPEEFTGTLEFKVWGKSRNLRLYFKSDQGDKYVLSVFSKGYAYAPINMPEFDMSHKNIQPGMKFKIKTKLNRNNNSNFLEAHVL